MNKANFIRWVKYTLAATAVFSLAGFILKVVVEGVAPAEAYSIFMEIGLYQSILYAMIVATLLTYKNS